MSGLTRRYAPKLLTQVNGKPHATAKDHEETLERSVHLKNENDDDISRSPDASFDGEEVKSNQNRNVQILVNTEKDDILRSPDASSDEDHESRQNKNGQASIKAEVKASTRPSPLEQTGPKDDFNGFKANGAHRAPFLEFEKARKPRRVIRKFGIRAHRTEPPKHNRDPLSGDDSDSDLMLPECSSRKKQKTEKSISTSNGNGTVPRTTSRKLARSSETNSTESVIKRTSKAPTESPLNLLEKMSTYGTITSNASAKPPNLSQNASDSAPRNSLKSTTSISLTLSDSSDFDSEEDMNPTCPLCKAPVSHFHLYTFRKANPQMNVRHQQRFCKEHRVRAAQETYRNRGYPDVDWEKLPKRLERYYPKLEAILRNTIDPPSATENISRTNEEGGVEGVPFAEEEGPSTYRRALEEAVSLGTDRTLFSSILKQSQNTASLSTGYYGHRGARILEEALTSRFATVIREVAIHDPVVRFGGFSNFVQRVLVPEVVWRLVVEDLKVGPEEARRVVNESAEIGELVNDELEDKVRVDDKGYDEEEG